MATSNGSLVINMISPLTPIDHNRSPHHFLQNPSLHFLTSSNPKPITTLRANSTPNAKALENLESLSADRMHRTERRRSVHIKFRLQRKCFFGDQILVVGDVHALGSWNPIYAVSLKWSEGHIWTAHLNLPVDRAIQYKFIQRDIEGSIQWQPGADRVFRTWETDSILVINEEWEDGEMQKITS